MDITLNIVVCDDDACFVDDMEKRVREIAKDNECDCNIVKLYSAKELLDYCNDNTADIIVTDIDMPDMYGKHDLPQLNMSGFKAADQLQMKYPETRIVFVTAHEELAYQSYRYKPFSFISKRELNMLDEDLGELIYKIHHLRSANKLFPLIIGQKTHMINVEETLYFKSDGHYIRAYSIDGKDTLYRCSIKQANEQLADANFIFVHRSYLINCKYIKYFDTQNVILTNGMTISVTRDEDKLSEAKAVFGRYKRSLR